MSTDFSAITVVGVKLPSDDYLPRAKITVRKKAFKHDYVDDGENEFHPKNGKILFLDEKEEVEANYPAYIFEDGEFDSGDDLYDGQTSIKIPKGLELKKSNDSEYFIGIIAQTGNSNGGDDYCFMKVDMVITKSKLMNFLEKYNLWDEETFGIHTLLYYS